MSKRKYRRGSQVQNVGEIPEHEWFIVYFGSSTKTLNQSVLASWQLRTCEKFINAGLVYVAEKIPEQQKKYQAELFYGYQEGECGIYHSFELTDPEAAEDTTELAEKLAGLLDTKLGSDDFNFDSMYVDLPATLVERIKADAIREYLDNTQGLRRKR